MRQVSIKETIQFIRDHHCLEGWTDEQIHIALHKSIQRYALVFSMDNSDNLIGLVFGYWNNPEEFYAQCNIGSLKTHLNHLRNNFPDCKRVLGLRNNRPIQIKVR